METFTKEDYARVEMRFNQNPKSFICTETLKIFNSTQNEETALKALELLEKVAQPF